jgi:Lon protease-like protein
MSFEMPLFPLNVVLFPGMSLPLHIFEPRYRQMISRCLQEDRTFGVVLMVEGQEDQEGALPAEIGCSSEITEATHFEDGRYNLQTIGRQRFRVLSAREEDDYLIGTVEWIEPEIPEEEAPRLSSQALRSLRRYLGAIGSNLETSVAEEWSVPSEPYALSMWIAALLAVPNPQKQQLLELDSTVARLELEVRLLRRAEVVQEAFMRRQNWPEPDLFDETTESYSQFLSLN